MAVVHVYCARLILALTADNKLILDLTFVYCLASNNLWLKPYDLLTRLIALHPLSIYITFKGKPPFTIYLFFELTFARFWCRMILRTYLNTTNVYEPNGNNPRVCSSN